MLAFYISHLYSKALNNFMGAFLFLRVMLVYPDSL